MSRFGFQPECPRGALFPRRIPSGVDGRNRATTIRTAPTNRAMFPPHAAPTMPRSGAPHAPKARAHAPTMLMTLTIAPAIIGVRVSPAPRIAPPTAIWMVNGAKPSIDTIRNDVAVSATSPVAPPNATAGPASAIPTMERMMLRAPPKTTPWRRAPAARTGVRAPVACATRTVVPMPTDINPLSTTKKTCKATPDPASAMVPRRPVIATSAMETAVDSSCSTTTGHARRITSRRSSPPVITTGTSASRATPEWPSEGGPLPTRSTALELGASSGRVAMDIGRLSGFP